VLSSPGDTDAAGFRVGVRIVADVLVGRAGYRRPGYAVFEPNERLASDVQVALFLALWAVVVVGVVVAWRRTGRTWVTGWWTIAATAVTAAVVDAAQLPETVFGYNSFNYRWLWPTATFLVLGALVALERRVRLPDPRIIPATMGIGLVVLVGCNLPEAIEVRDPALYAESRRVVAEMTDQLASVPIDGPVVIDQSNLFFGHPYAYPVGVVLRDRGIDYRFEGEMQRRRFGESRVADGTEPTRLVILHGADARDRWNDDDVVASVGGLDPIVVVKEVAG
jgi:hypothetical protein